METRRCPFCGALLSLKDIIFEERIGKKRGRPIIRVVYRCPKCKRNVVIERPYAKYKIEEEDVAWKITGRLDLNRRERFVDIIFRRKKNGSTDYMNHEVYGEHGRMVHFGIKGIRGYKDNRVLFEKSEWVDVDNGVRKDEWRKKSRGKKL